MSESPAVQNQEKPVAHDEAVYELDEIWDIDWFTQSDHDRIRDLISMLPETAVSLLDVGCGNGLFVNSLAKLSPKERPRRLYAVDRSASALKHVEVEHRRCDIRNLPFSDGEFDIVTCLEVVEHLPLSTYAAALSELSRVAARWIMISVPFEQNLSKSLCECPSCTTRFNPDYHLRSFNEGKLRHLFRNQGHTAARVELLGTIDEYIGYHRIRRLFKRESTGNNTFPTSTICPMCGYREPEALAVELASRRRNSKIRRQPGGPSPLRKLAGLLWPKRQRHNWVAVLYEKHSGEV